MNEMNIDFEQAKNISNDIIAKYDVIDDILNHSKNISSFFNYIPSKYSEETMADIINMQNVLSDVSDLISNLGTAFDSSVQKYYDFENGVESSDNSILNNDIGLNSKPSSNFTWGYKMNSKGVTKISREEMLQYLLNNGATQGQYKDVYNITVNGVDYRYNVSNNTIYVGNERFKCDFYVSNGYNGNTNNVVTLLGGTGEDLSGSFRPDKISTDISFGKSAVLVVPYSGEEHKYISPNAVVASTNFASGIFNAPDDATQGIIGYSEGSQVTATTVSKNPGIYDEVVFVNGASYSADGYTEYVRNGYDGFKEANVTYVETLNGWPRGLNTGQTDLTDQRAVTYSIKSMVDNGVNPGNITLVTNDSALSDSVVNRGINIDNTMPEPAKGTDGKQHYIRHGQGAWDIFNESGILEYLSTK